MGTWTVDTERKAGVLYLEFDGLMSVEDLEAFVVAHNAAIDRFAGADYRVFVDIRTMSVLSPVCADLFEKAKAYSSSQPNFVRSAVWVATALTAIQHRRTSVAGGVMPKELIGADEDALWAHLEPALV